MEPTPSVLIVDDDEDVRQAFVDALTFEGFAVVAARNGQEAVDWLRHHAALSCVVLLDLTMPVMDGRTFLSLRMEDQILSRFPIIVLTADLEFRAVQTFNVSRCLPKTVPWPELLNAITTCARDAFGEDDSRPL